MLRRLSSIEEDKRKMEMRLKTFEESSRNKYSYALKEENRHNQAKSWEIPQEKLGNFYAESEAEDNEDSFWSYEELEPVQDETQDSYAGSEPEDNFEESEAEDNFDENELKCSFEVRKRVEVAKGIEFQEDMMQKNHPVVIEEDNEFQEDMAQRDNSVVQEEDQFSSLENNETATTVSGSIKPRTITGGLKNRIKVFKTQCSKLARRCRIVTRK